ncbi:MAG: T9SS type A sorting domain-containing protein [Bacteroidia bacterium]
MSIKECLFELSTFENPALELNKLTIYPNPSNNGTFILNTSSNEAMLIEVYSTEGKLLLSELLKPNANNEFVLKTELSNGIFLLKSTQGESVYVKSISIE